MNYYIEDFTEENYRRLLELGKKNSCFLMYDDASLASSAIVLRHDIDFSVHRAVALARIEAEYNIRAVYFVHFHNMFYNVMEKEISDILKEIASKGHKIGLHFEPAYYNLKIDDKEMLIEKANKERELLESIINEKNNNLQKVEYISFHNPDVGGNWYLIDDDKIGTMVNVYNKRIRETFEYCSDSNGYWRYKRLEDVLSKCKGKKLHILTHPAWWQKEIMYPYDRIKRCANGRLTSVLKKYSDDLKSFGRINVTDDYPNINNMKALGTIFLESYRLQFRKFSEEDVDDLYNNWGKDPEVTRYLSWDAYNTIEDARSVIRKWIDSYDNLNFYQWAIVKKDSQKVIGGISAYKVDYKNSTVAISYCIGKKYWNNGYMTEAFNCIISFFFEDVNVNRIEAAHDVRNIYSGKVMKKCHLTYEGTQRQSIINAYGEYCDIDEYSILKDEYFKQKSYRLN